MKSNELKGFVNRLPSLLSIVDEFFSQKSLRKTSWKRYCLIHSFSLFDFFLAASRIRTSLVTVSSKLRAIFSSSSKVLGWGLLGFYKASIQDPRIFNEFQRDLEWIWV